MSSPFASIEQARERLGALVHKYTQNREHYHHSSYNEETARSEFISPFFEALGWDVTNRQALAPAYKDVIHEESQRTGELGTKAPDYTFRVGGQRKFFVEAKKPFVDVKNDPAPANQLRRYAWTAKLPLSILTDFEEFAVYDTRKRPEEKDKASVARVQLLGFEEYLPKLDDIWNVFSKEAVYKGSFDRYAEETLGKRGTSEVDAEFLRELERWRDELARNIALRNKERDLSVDELNFAVQATIDRILFLRIAEGRGVETYGQLQALTNGENVYPRLMHVFRKADTKYNSGIFDFKSDHLTPKLEVDDKVVRGILGNLYYPQSPYEFSVLPPEILGNVYEQFLGKVIRLTEGGRAKIEEKPEVKKAGGVYYTPTYIVEYIVKHTVGKLCEGKSPAQMAKLRILDPACGSGSFLLVAFQALMDAHLSWYRDHNPKKHTKEVFLAPGSEANNWRLTTAEKRRILISSIHGVDIDRQAVEVSKLSLLLRVLEGDNAETMEKQLAFGERALPSLEANIKCGNSLVGTDAFDGSLFPDPDDVRRINPFDWQTSFPEVFARGGFDAVIGNPPYAYRNATEGGLRPYYDDRYVSAEGNYDLYKFFLERSLSLTREGGRVGMIVSSTFLVQPSYTKLRAHLLDESRIVVLAPLGPGAFQRATVDTTVLVLVKEHPEPRHRVEIVAPPVPNLLTQTASYSVPQKRFFTNVTQVFDYRLGDDAARITQRVFNSFPSLEQGFEFGVGINTGMIRDQMVSNTRADARYHPMVPGTGISRYGPVETRGWIMYDPEFVRSQGNLGRSLPPLRFFEQDKILVVRTRNLALPRRVIATFDRAKTFNLNRLSNIIARPGYSLLGLLAILNSSFFNWLYSTRYFDYEIKPIYLRNSPLADCNVKELERASERMLDLQLRFLGAKTAHDRDLLSRQIAGTDREIDRLVYELYRLTPEEIAIVEKATKD